MDMGRADSFRTNSDAGMGAGPAPTALPHGQLQLLTTQQLAEPAFIAAWERLAARAGEPNPFYEPWFLLPSLQQWAATDRVITKAWFHQGRLAGLLPVVRSAKYYSHILTHATGWQFGPVGTVISIMTGLALVFFSVSGLWMYVSMWRNRKDRKLTPSWFWR
jgi:hypothetical protein